MHFSVGTRYTVGQKSKLVASFTPHSRGFCPVLISIFAYCHHLTEHSSAANASRWKKAALHFERRMPKFRFQTDRF